MRLPKAFKKALKKSKNLQLKVYDKVLGDKILALPLEEQVKLARKLVLLRSGWWLSPFLRLDASIKFAPPFHMWTRLILIGFCQLSRYFAFITSATVTAWKQNNRHTGMQHLVSQVLRKWATLRESFRHYTWIIRYQGYLIKYQYQGVK